MPRLRPARHLQGRKVAATRDLHIGAGPLGFAQRRADPGMNRQPRLYRLLYAHCTGPCGNSRQQEERERSSHPPPPTPALLHQATTCTVLSSTNSVVLPKVYTS
ncbi:hypothetical protein D3C72_1484070 [compost metagenome]